MSALFLTCKTSQEKTRKDKTLSSAAGFREGPPGLPRVSSSTVEEVPAHKKLSESCCQLDQCVTEDEMDGLQVSQTVTDCSSVTLLSSLFVLVLSLFIVVLRLYVLVLSASVWVFSLSS